MTSNHEMKPTPQLRNNARVFATNPALAYLFLVRPFTRMKKFFAVLGVIFLIIIVLGAIGFGFIAMRGSALDKESKAYADRAILAIVTTWSEKELLDRASPEFDHAVSQVQLDQQFHRFFVGLGHLQRCEPAQGHSITSATTQAGIQVRAEYTANATFDKGAAVIDITLIKHGDQWQILAFFVKSPELRFEQRT
jgi:hypothetical protein